MKTGKLYSSLELAVQDIHDNAIILIGGFGGAGMPTDLIEALIDQGAKDLTVVSNNAGNFENGLAALLKARRVRKIICSFPKASHSWVFNELYKNGEIELECVPQGTIAARLHAGGAGLGGIFTPTGFGTLLTEGKETREISGVNYVFEESLRGDFALVMAERSDSLGNLVYRKAQRNFGPVMCMAAKTSIVQVREVVAAGDLDPESIITPGIFVNRVVEVNNPTRSS